MIPVADIIRHHHKQLPNSGDTVVNMYISHLVKFGEEIYTSHYICDGNLSLQKMGIILWYYWTLS